MKALEAVRMSLKAPKGQYNAHGKFNYRSCEDILEAVKPLMDKNGVELQLTDELVMVGERYYIRAEATAIADGEVVVAVGYAREPESRTGMDASQITGCASSYARKYALNALFLIDDNKDADALPPDKPKQPKNQEQADPVEELAAMWQACIELGIDKQGMSEWYGTYFPGKRLGDLDETERETVRAYLTEKLEATNE